jgi:hypothetical protein
MRHSLRLLILPLIATVLFLTGCATTLRSEVTAYHEWPNDAAGKTFDFQHHEGDTQSLERQNVENLVRAQLLRVGLRDPGPGEAAQLSVRVEYANDGRDVRVVETVLVDPWYGSPWYGPGFYNPYWGWSGYGHPFYRPMWPSIPMARDVERRYTVFRRELKVKISEAGSGRPLHEVTVRSEGQEGNLAIVMPYLAEAAFRNFPGPSGVPQVIEMKLKQR